MYAELLECEHSVSLGTRLELSFHSLYMDIRSSVLHIQALYCLLDEKNKCFTFFTDWLIQNTLSLLKNARVLGNQLQVFTIM